MSPSFRDGLAALRYVLDVPGGTTVWPLEPVWTSPEHQGIGRPRKPRLVGGQRRTMEERSDELPEEAWREITVAEGSQGPRSYRALRGCVQPTEASTAIAGTWTAASPATPVQRSHTPLETLAYVGGSRWRIDSRRRRATWGWTSTRPAPGRDGIITALCLLGGFLLTTGLCALVVDGGVVSEVSKERRTCPSLPQSSYHEPSL